MNHFKILRPVALPGGVPGKLYLHSMPGRYEPLENCFAEMTTASLYRIVCLVGLAEIGKKSPGYARALAQEATPAPVILFPIEDYSTPAEVDQAWSLIHDIAADLKQGRNMLIHCAGGHGRTGTFAICVLIALGLGPDEARKKVNAAGANPDNGKQEAFIDDFIAHLSLWPTLDEARRIFGNAFAEKCPMQRSRISQLDFLRGLIHEMRALGGHVILRFIVPKFERLIAQTKNCYSCQARSLAMAELVCAKILPEQARRYRELFEAHTRAEDEDEDDEREFPTAAEFRAQVTPFDKRLRLG